MKGSWTQQGISTDFIYSSPHSELSLLFHIAVRNKETEDQGDSIFYNFITMQLKLSHTSLNYV